MVDHKQKKKIEEYEKLFRRYYIDFLQSEKNLDDILRSNQESLTELQRNIIIDSNSISILPAYFNFIEFYLDSNTASEVRKYLTVALSNLSFTNKKKEEMKDGDYSYNNNIENNVKDDDTNIDIKEKESRIDLLFGRYNLLRKDYPKAREKLCSSIITYAEIYGPESVGLTPHYYYLASYFLENSYNNDSDYLGSEYKAKNIFLKIADIWKKYFLEEKNELYLSNDDKELSLAIGEYYVIKILHKISKVIKEKKNSELELKFKFIKVILGRENKKDIDDEFKKVSNSYNEFVRKENEEISKIQKKHFSNLNNNESYHKGTELYPFLWQKVDENLKIIDKEFFLNLEQKFKGEL